MKKTHKIFLRVGGKIYRSTSARSFSGRLLRLVNSQFAFPKVYLRVNYGKKEDAYGRNTEFYNDIETDNRKEFLQAYKAFCE